MRNVKLGMSKCIKLFLDYIQPINLPTEEMVYNVETVAIGWGQTDDGEYHEGTDTRFCGFMFTATAGLASQLNYATVSTISNTECQLSFTDVIFDNMVCAAGNYNEGTCNVSRILLGYENLVTVVCFRGTVEVL
mgnify:FL=1